MCKCCGVCVCVCVCVCQVVLHCLLSSIFSAQKWHEQRCGGANLYAVEEGLSEEMLLWHGRSRLPALYMVATTPTPSPPPSSLERKRAVCVCVCVCVCVWRHTHHIHTVLPHIL